MRPVFRRKGKVPDGSDASAGRATTTNRPRPSSVKKRPAAKKRSRVYPSADRRARRCRPSRGCGRPIGLGVPCGQSGDVEGTGAVVLEPRQGRVLTEDRCGVGEICEGVPVSETARDHRHDRPIGACLAGRREESALTRDPALRVRDGAVFLAHARAGSSTVLAPSIREPSGIGDRFRDHV